jgi:hypothetical protein
LRTVRISLEVELIDVADDVPRAKVLEVKSRGLKIIHKIGATRDHLLLLLLLARPSILHWSGGGRAVDAHCGDTIIEALKFYLKDKENKFAYDRRCPLLRSHSKSDCSWHCGPLRVAGACDL